jgi:hypothetical protein
MLKSVFHLFLFICWWTFYAHLLLFDIMNQLSITLHFGCLFLGERFGCGCSLCFSYPGESSSKAKTPYLQGSWKNQSYVVLFVLVCLNQSFIVMTFLFLYMLDLLFFVCSLHVISMPHWADIVRERRGCPERGIDLSFCCNNLLFHLHHTNLFLFLQPETQLATNKKKSQALRSGASS